MGVDVPRPHLAGTGEEDEDDQLRQEVWTYLCQVHDHEVLVALRTIVASHVTRQGTQEARHLTDMLWLLVTSSWWLSVLV